MKFLSLNYEEKKYPGTQSLPIGYTFTLFSYHALSILIGRPSIFGIVSDQRNVHFSKLTKPILLPVSPVQGTQFNSYPGKGVFELFALGLWGHYSTTD